VRDRYILNGYAPILAEILEVTAGKCRTKVGDDTVRQPKPMDDVVEELRCFLCYRLDERLVLDPLGEFVNSDINPSESAGAFLNGPIMSSPQHANGQEAGIIYRA